MTRRRPLHRDAAAPRLEVTATDHAGYLRFTYPPGSKASVLVEATRPGIHGFVKIDTARNEIVGYNPDRMDSNLGPLKLPNFKGATMRSS